MAGKGAFNKHSGAVVGGSPSNSIATKHGGSVKKFSHTAHPGGNLHKSKAAGHTHHLSRKKM
jgi:hypothetical protein